MGRKISHGMSKTRIYKIYSLINERCNNSSHKRFKDYGNRGIENKWNTFEEFYEDMSDSYKEGLTIDRIDVNGNYCKENCKWSTYKEQANNRRSNILFTHNGVTKSVSDWCVELGIDNNTVYKRISKCKWTVKKALFTKVRKYSRPLTTTA